MEERKKCAFPQNYRASGIGGEGMNVDKYGVSVNTCHKNEAFY